MSALREVGGSSAIGFPRPACHLPASGKARTRRVFASSRRRGNWNSGRRRIWLRLRASLLCRRYSGRHLHRRASHAAHGAGWTRPRGRRSGTGGSAPSTGACCSAPGQAPLQAESKETLRGPNSSWCWVIACSEGAISRKPKSVIFRYSGWTRARYRPLVRLAQIALVRDQFAEVADRLREAETAQPGWIVTAPTSSRFTGSPTSSPATWPAWNPISRCIPTIGTRGWCWGPSGISPVEPLARPMCFFASMIPAQARRRTRRVPPGDQSAVSTSRSILPRSCLNRPPAGCGARHQRCTWLYLIELPCTRSHATMPRPVRLTFPVPGTATRSLVGPIDLAPFGPSAIATAAIVSFRTSGRMPILSFTPGQSIVPARVPREIRHALARSECRSSVFRQSSAWPGRSVFIFDHAA